MLVAISLAAVLLVPAVPLFAIPVALSLLAVGRRVGQQGLAAKRAS